MMLATMTKEGGVTGSFKTIWKSERSKFVHWAFRPRSAVGGQSTDLLEAMEATERQEDPISVESVDLAGIGQLNKKLFHALTLLVEGDAFTTVETKRKRTAWRSGGSW